jgi:hypothetical protein
MDDDLQFLTEKRLKVLTGDYEGADNVRRTHLSNIREQSRLALSDLIRVAESPHVDTTEVIDPEALAALVRAVMTPDAGAGHTEGGGGVVGPTTDETEDYAAGLSDEFRLYRDDVFFALSEVVDGYPDRRDLGD